MKLYRKRLIIDKLENQIHLHHPLIFKQNPDYKNNKSETNIIFHVAKNLLQLGLFYNIETTFETGIQTINLGTVGYRGKMEKINYEKVLDIVTQKTYEKIQKRIPSKSEQKVIIKNYGRNRQDENYKKKFDDLRENISSSNPELIRKRLENKLNEYLMKKSSYNS
jgi:hypothetical protein